MLVFVRKALKALNKPESIWYFLLGILCGQFEYCGYFPFAPAAYTSALLMNKAGYTALFGSCVGLILRGAYRELIPLFIICAAVILLQARLRRRLKAIGCIGIMCISSLCSLVFRPFSLFGCALMLLMCTVSALAVFIITNGLKTLRACTERRRIASDAELIYVSLFVGFCVLGLSDLQIFGAHPATIAAGIVVLLLSSSRSPYGLYTALLASAGAGLRAGEYSVAVPAVLSVSTVFCSLVRKRGKIASVGAFAFISLALGTLLTQSMSIADIAFAGALFICVPDKTAEQTTLLFQRLPKKRTTLRQRLDDIKRATESLSTVLDESTLAGDGKLAIRQLGNMPEILEKACDEKICGRIFSLETGVSGTPKANCEHTGDSVCIQSLGRSEIAAVSDGMGSGILAHNESSRALRIFFEMQKAGFGLYGSIDCVNRLLLTATENDIYATLDALIIDCCSGTATSVKAGAPSAFLVREKRVHTISGEALPLGIVESVTPAVKTMRIYDGDIFILLTDGVSDALGQDLIATIAEKTSQDEDAKKIANDLLASALGEGAQDDMSIVCIKVHKN